MPEMSDMTEEELLAALQSAIQQGDETKARVIAELIEDRKMPESGIAMIAPESVGEVPEGGIMGMYDGGAVAFRTGNEVLSPYRLTAEEQMMLLQPDPEEESAAGRALRNLGGAAKRAFMYSSDAEALREQGRLPSASPLAAVPVAASGGGRGIEAGPTAEDLAQATRENPRMMAGLPALEKAPAADAPAGNVATPGGARTGGGGMGVEQIMGIMREAGYDPKAAQADLIARQEQLARDRAAGVAADRAALDKMIAERGVYGKEQEERMRGELEGLTGKRGEAKNFALIQAGLSILSADPSRGALAAIGQGAIQGLGAYKGDIDKLEAKRDKINERTDRILDIRRQERMADDDKRMQLQKEENRLKEANSRDMFDLYKGFGVEDRAVATAVTQQVISSREKELDRRDRADRIAKGSKTNPAQYRMLLTNEIGELLKRKESGVDWTADDESQLKQLRQERDGLRAYLSTSVGASGQAAPAANMTGWGKATVE
jgi:hypothetical protein